MRFPAPEQAATEAKPKVKNDPGLVAAARELRDQWLEQVNADPSALSSQGKYDVRKELAAPTPREILQLPQPIVAWASRIAIAADFLRTIKGLL